MLLSFKEHLNEATLDITTMNKQLAGVQRSEILANAIKNKTKLQTSKGNVVITWLKDEDKVAFDMNDFQNAFKDGKSYKQVFSTEKGDTLKLSDITKTAMFGGGAGSSGGSKNTAKVESGQCVYLAALYNGRKFKDTTDSLDDAEMSAVAQGYNISVSLNEVATMNDAWVASSIITAQKLKSFLGNKSFIFHHQSPFVKNLYGSYSKLNKQLPSPFKGPDKWNPADIWAVDGVENHDWYQYNSLAEINNTLKEMYVKRQCVGISLKQASGSVTLSEKNTKGFIRRPIRMKDYDNGKKGVFDSKHCTIYGTEDFIMPMKVYDGLFGGFAGEIQLKKSRGGKVRGTLIDELIKTKPKFNDRDLAKNVVRPSPSFIHACYQTYLAVTKNKREFKLESDFTKEFKKVAKKNKSLVFSKFKAMDMIGRLINQRNRKHEIVDALAAYAMSESKDSGPYVIAK